MGNKVSDIGPKTKQKEESDSKSKQKEESDSKKVSEIVELLKVQKDSDCLEKVKAFKPKELSEYRYKRRAKSDKGVQERPAEGKNEEELWGYTVLHLATAFDKTDTAKHLCDVLPELIGLSIEGYYPTLTALDLAVSQGNEELVRHMLDQLRKTDKEKKTKTLEKILSGGCTKQDEEKKNDKAKSRSNGTVFMGELPLFVAVLSYIALTKHKQPTMMDESAPEQDEDPHMKIIEILLEKDGIDYLGKNNSERDTVFHTIMKFVNCFPRKEDKARLAIRILHRKLTEKAKLNETVWRVREFYFRRNAKDQTAMDLTAKFGLTDIFADLWKTIDVYQIVRPYDSVYEIERYDITDVEQRLHTPISELICSRVRIETCVKMISSNVFHLFTKEQWQKYRLFYAIFFLFHLLNVVLMNWYIVVKGQKDANGQTPFSIIGFNVYFLIVGIIYVVQEMLRFYTYMRISERILKISMKNHGYFSLTAIHHNSIYRLCLVIAGVCLFLDSVITLSCDFVPSCGVPYFIPFGLTMCALFLSTWFLLFFLRGCPYFSVYIVLINEALFKAVLPFVVLIFMQVFTFTSAMHSFFLDLEQGPIPGDNLFDGYGKSLLAMGKLMIGLTEVEPLLDSDKDALVLISFFFFLLVTFLLMINALIGVMTNRFQYTQENRIPVNILQKLSIIRFFSDLIHPQCFKEKKFTIGESLSDYVHVRPANEEQNLKQQNEYENLTEEIKSRRVLAFRKVLSDDVGEPVNLENQIKHASSQIDQLRETLNQLMENTTHRDTGPARLHVYHYSKE